MWASTKVSTEQDIGKSGLLAKILGALAAGY
jgi:hypothetical protein